MFWALAVAGGFGLLLGLRYRMPAALAASIVVVLATAAIAPLSGWSLLATLGLAAGATIALQCGYLAGLMVVCAVTRGRLWPRLIRRQLFGHGGAVLTRPRARAR